MSDSSGSQRAESPSQVDAPIRVDAATQVEPSSQQSPFNNGQCPSVPKGRTIVLCFDGTGNKFGTNSNVVRFMSALDKTSPNMQIIYYQPGIGTYLSRKFFTKTFSWIWSYMDVAFAWNLADHVKDGYKFLMKNHRPGDKICLFGFSRGAYTARALAGMIYKVGLLLPDNDEQLEFAYQVYMATDLEGAFLAREFKETFSLSVKVHLLGVWDTVASVGLIPRSLPYSTQNDGVINFRHALALDERRARFRPNLWGEPITFREELDTIPQLNKVPMSRDAYVYYPPATTDVKEVWFAGTHADVGGGSHPTYHPTSLSRIPLRWMIRECFLTKSGVLFEKESLWRNSELELKELQERPETVKIHGIRPGTSKYTQLRTWYSNIKVTKEMHDIFSNIYDQLEIILFWWILELLPVLSTYQKGDGTWAHWRRRNFGNGRYLPEADEHIRVHESVRERILRDNAGLKNGEERYWPRALNWRRVKYAVEWEK